MSSAPNPQTDLRPGVLIVDDTVANQRAFQSVLESDGYDIAVAGSGQEALKLVLKREFAVILLDVRMPGMDGIETATFLRCGSSAGYSASRRRARPRRSANTPRRRWPGSGRARMRSRFPRWDFQRGRWNFHLTNICMAWCHISSTVQPRKLCGTPELIPLPCPWNRDGASE